MMNKTHKILLVVLVVVILAVIIWPFIRKDKQPLINETPQVQSGFNGKNAIFSIDSQTQLLKM